MTTHPPTATRPVGRRLGEAAFPAVASVTAVVAPLVVFDRLPDPIASHWGWSGGPDGSLPLLLDAVLLATVTAVVALGPLLAARGAVPRDLARLLVGVAGAAGVFLAGLRVASVQANLDAPAWEAAASLPGATLAVTAVGAMLAAAVGAWAAGDRPDRSPELSAPDDVEVQPGEAIVWSGVASSRGGIAATLVAVGLLVAGVAVVPAEGRSIVVGLLALGVLLAGTLGQVRVTVGPAGLTARLGWLGLPRVHVPITDVEAVRVEKVVPYEYGGWGYRVVPGARAIVVRKGPGLRIERRSRPALVVTVDGAAEAAGVLLAHRAAAADGAST